jgi:hypothetical protein
MAVTPLGPATHHVFLSLSATPLTPAQ